MQDHQFDDAFPAPSVLSFFRCRPMRTSASCQRYLGIQGLYQFSTVILAAARVTGRVSLATFTE
jgi:hypothetical protein